ncbi:MAG: hypothetical protein HYW05_04610 [Candidatus Diapherotrites archaeon]|nr:hypothetical protein [Candidatus Diapherotrites archaeon]
MGFFGKIFGKRGAKEAEFHEEKAVEISFQGLEKWIDEKTSAQRNGFDRKIMGKFAEIKGTVQEIKNQLDEISGKEISTEEGNKRLRKIVDTSKQGMLRGMRTLLEKLEPPKTQDYRALSDYCNNSSSLLQAEISAFGKNIAYTGILLQVEVKKIGELINALAGEFSEIQKIFAESGVMYIPQIRQKISEIEAEISAKKALQDSLPKIEQEIALLESGKEDAVKSTNALRVSDDYEELQELQEGRAKLLSQKQALKEKILQMFAPIEKPLRKLQNLSANRQFALADKQEENALSQYLMNPLLAIAEDSEAKILKALLSSVQQAMGSGLIDFKDAREKEKKSLAVSELLQSASLWQEIQEYLGLNEQIASAEKELQKSSIAGRISDAEESARRIERNIQEMNAALARGQNSLNKKEQEISAMLSHLSGLASKAANANVRVIAQKP